MKEVAARIMPLALWRKPEPLTGISFVTVVPETFRSSEVSFDAKRWHDCSRGFQATAPEPVEIFRRISDDLNLIRRDATVNSFAFAFLALKGQAKFRATLRDVS